MFVVAGTLVFNEIIVLPILGFDLYTKPALALRAKKDMQEYMEKTSGENDQFIDRKTNGENRAIQRETTAMNGSVLGDN